MKPVAIPDASSSLPVLEIDPTSLWWNSNVILTWLGTVDRPMQSYGMCRFFFGGGGTHTQCFSAYIWKDIC